MNSLTDDFDYNVAVGDRVILSEAAGEFAGQAGLVTSYDHYISMYYNTDVVVVLTDSGTRIAAFITVLIKSPYQGELLEEVPSV